MRSLDNDPTREHPLLFRYTNVGQAKHWAELWQTSEYLMLMAQHAFLKNMDETGQELDKLANEYRRGVLQAVEALVELGKEDERLASLPFLPDED
jgi:hypothetical protein